MARANRHQTHMVSLQTMVDEAIEFILKHKPNDAPYFLAFSGGKDSIVLKELARMSGVEYQVFYSATGIDPPEVVKFIRTYHSDTQWLRPKMTFWEGIRRRDPPTRWQRWCCDVLKKQFRHIPLRHHLLGIRGEESRQRKEQSRLDFHTKLKVWQYKPIFHWKLWHVWDFIESHQLPYPSLYNDGWDRIGCVICPMHCHKNMVQITRNMQRWPGMFKVFEKVLAEWYNTKRRNKDKDYKTPEEYIRAWYRGFE